MKKLFKLGIVFVVVLAGSTFIVSSFLKASRPPQAAEPPVISAAPVKVFGVIEPAGREVFVGPPLARRIISVHAVEGDTVVRGQLLAELENSVERAQVALNETKIELARKAIELEEDSMKRSQQLFKKKIDSEYTYTQARLRKELEEKRLAVSSDELSHAQAQLEQTMLRSPIDGMIYKFDVRLGETLQSGDNSRIILGEKGYWARMWVESFWRERISPDSIYTLYDSETRKKIGTGKFLKRIPYMGRRDFRTEDLQERFDTKFQEVILEVEPVAGETLPIGITVMAELAQ
jgi:multidrug efflux pump subunit AcrA (membrane-fusion protein)